MGKNDDRKSIAARNPKVDLKDVGEALELVRQLRDMGLTQAGYNLSSPFGPSVAHSSSEDSWKTTPVLPSSQRSAR